MASGSFIAAWPRTAHGARSKRFVWVISSVAASLPEAQQRDHGLRLLRSWRGCGCSQQWREGAGRAR